jgi:hypothetical protein
LSTKAAFTVLVQRWDLAHDVPAFIAAVAAMPVNGKPSALQRDWMLWIEHILQPSNRAMVEIILTHTNGFDSTPAFLANIVAHAGEFDVILVKWKEGDLSHMNASLPFDDRINDFVGREFERLRRRKRGVLEAMEVEHKMDPESMEVDAGIELVGETRGSTNDLLLGRSSAAKRPTALGKGLSKGRGRVEPSTTTSSA